MPQKANPTFSLKDELFNPTKVEFLTNQISNVRLDFDSKQFQSDVEAKLGELELKQRIVHITECLCKHLPSEYSEALSTLLNALPQELDPNRQDDDFGDYILAPFNNFVATYGCTQDHLDESLQALKEMTKRFSAEDAVRYFINTFPEETLRFLYTCSTDKNYHVRRWASEGTRPKLPWSQKLIIDYHQALPILDSVFDDKTRYVTRSVANHLNDIAKISPELVIETLKKWKQSKEQNEKEMQWIIQHATRTLVKNGDLEALNLLGFGDTPDISISDLTTSTPQVKIGDSFNFSFTIEAHKDQNLLVDYIMYFSNPKKKDSKKVFKLKKLSSEKNKTIEINKKHRLRPMTTRTLYEGEHRIEIMINGKNFGELSFELKD